MAYKDYYDVLGVSRSASDADIKSAYRKLAKQYHPDKNQGDEKAADKFKEIGEAYAVLNDPEKRKLYDQYGHTGQVPPGYGDAGMGGGFQGGDFGGFDPGQFSDFFQQMFGGRGGMGGMGGRGGFAGGQVNLDDLFGGASGGLGGAGAGRRFVQNVEGELQVTLREALEGSDEVINVDGKRLSLRVPAGTRDGARLRLAGQGPGGGDVLLTIRVLEDARFELDGDDLTTTVDVPAPVAALGGEVKVQLLSGKSGNLNVPAGSSGGRKMRLRGQGWPKKSGGNGDLYVRLNVTVPKDLSDEEKELYTKLRDLQK
ncbi:DnaJ C-terminal domain-containing protein [Deinococcus radiodurans]|jgi:DnaJ-class molecular chaperone with C-terminal Zn finger domain|uniref:DnaJ C-terminal domain-containing protein n=1 Tax=Deinococcus radiodurans TaxID=1299 RepID=UPI0000164CD5|nr:DnaJ C-terminal domain-containing protein [Deinococcus radiodurans]ANC72587.1 molecular chaperone DnaJ [Deinococcus radiodurans R1 = ATCC 13939 = DSM 20539]QEM72098.1 molecular chaperone DnaJ [Deinococcus radiodurans]QIP28370.1 DnaJ domain-containing protein [Deinococcus radiodurans]QIP32914.1 DnaJ domain-containing protein [Deinococcus radiodurans]UDK99331.1 molecular chaperone DnaJ [Deinococcus radiodurans R1 = ATCC 13939 = DSM 20539]